MKWPKKNNFNNLPTEKHVISTPAPFCSTLFVQKFPEKDIHTIHKLSTPDLFRHKQDKKPFMRVKLYL